MARVDEGGGGAPRPKPTNKPKSLGDSLGAAVGSMANTVFGNNRPRNTGGGNRNRNRGGSGGGNRNRGSGGSGYVPPRPPRVSNPRPPVGNTPGGTIARSVPAPPPPISVEDYLAKDTAFNSQRSAYQKALADYAAQMQAEQGKYSGEYDAQVKQMGLDRTQGAQALQDDYASRGLLQSGVYGDALGQFNQKYDTQQADLERAKQAYLDDLKTGQTNFQTTQSALLEKARQDAMNRRLDSLKV